MQPYKLIVLALALGAFGCAWLAYAALARLAADRRSARMLAGALDRRALAAGASAPSTTSPATPRARTNDSPSAERPSTLAGRLAAWRNRFGHAGARWLDTPLGKHIVASEDRRLIEQCGFVDADARGFFLLSRLGCAFAAPAITGWLWGDHVPGAYRIAFVVGMFTAGFMLPKFALARRAAKRRRAVADEMPVLVDLLRLLQGVGLSLDQSLQVIVGDFRSMLPVLAVELELAQRQFAAGRTREQSLQRLGTSFDNEDLRAVVRLMIQVDRHGGAVQEPLKQFGDRLREARRAMLRERIGHLTVKMTGVMIVTLLPALLIVTAGPGLLAVIRSLAAVHR